MKRELILIRHSKTIIAEMGMRDFDRPLKKDRTDDAKNMAKYLKGLGLKPELILCSPALRTKQTAELFCEKLNYDYNKIVFDERLYESSAEEYLQVISETESEITTLVVIGHNPSVSFLAGKLANRFLDDMPTSGTAWLSLESDDWKMDTTTLCKLEHFLSPKTI